MINLKSERFTVIDEQKQGFTKKRHFDKKEVRCLQSKINLKFPIKDMLHEKPKEQIRLKEGHLEEFEKIYQAMCNPIY